MIGKPKKKTVQDGSTHATRLTLVLAQKMIEIAIESGASYGEIRKSCSLVLEILENGTRPVFAFNKYGERTISGFRET